MSNNSDQAYPRIVPEGDQLQKGLTKRELIAAMAMAGILNSWVANTEDDFIELAKKSVKAADVLLSQLEKRNDYGKQQRTNIG